MRPLLQHAQRTLSSNPRVVVSSPPARTFSSFLRSVSSPPSSCLQCQHRASVRYPWPSQGPYRRNIHQPPGDDNAKQDETPEERLARVRADIALREKQERERLEKERLEREKQEKERLERERLEQERLEQERQDKERRDREALEREKQSNTRRKTVPNVIELPPSNAAPTSQISSSSLPHVAEPSSSHTLSPSKNASTDKVGLKDGPRGDSPKNHVEPVPEDQLPSHHHARRWDLSKRFQELMDDVLPKLAVVTRKVNTYTGTDYSGIEALKREIKDHETLVKKRRAAIDEKKEALDTALSQQASAQKEVVALLERKHSWSDRDLERYMSLIRSEHINDQAVREAKEAIKQAENSLEEARSRLEKRERAQYHEEQIWSDTIRRNSTWVTFGLMGLNIFLLLVTMIVIEPWRRRRMVREIKTALEAQQTIVQPAATVAPLTAIPPVGIAAATTSVVSAEIEKASTPVENVFTTPVATGTVDVASPSQPDAMVITSTNEPPSSTLDVTAKLADDRPLEVSEANIIPAGEEQAAPFDTVIVEEDIRDSLPPKFETWQERVSYIAKDIFSDRTISVRRIDYTAAVLQGAAAGAVITAAIVAMIVGR